MAVEKANKQARNRSLLWLAVLCLPLPVLLDRLPSFLQGLADSPEILASRLSLICVVLYLLVLPMLVLCLWLWRFASTVVSGQRFPPVGTQVIRDIPVLEGEAAVTRGRIIQCLTAILFVLFTLLPLVFVYVLGIML